MVRNEHDLQVSIIDRIKLYEPQYPELTLLHAIPNGGQRHKAIAVKLKAEGVKAGVPDLCLPVARNGFHGFYRELKTKTGTMRASQKMWLRALEKNGYSVGVCRDVDQAVIEIVSYVRGPKTEVLTDA